MLDPVNCLEQFLHVTRYTLYLLLHAMWWRILYVRPVKVLDECYDSWAMLVSIATSRSVIKVTAITVGKFLEAGPDKVTSQAA